MKKRFLTAMILMGLLTGAAAAHAEDLEGLIISIDAKKNQMDIVPAGVSENISVSVSEFIKAHGPTALDDLDIGRHISMTIQKDSGGRWAMTAIQRPEVIIPAA